VGLLGGGGGVGCIGKALENYISDGVTVNPFIECILFFLI